MKKEVKYLAGWNLKEGVLKVVKLSDDEYWSLFNFVFSDGCHKTNTYKFGLIKSICDQIYDFTDIQYGYFITYNKIFGKFAENYWNLVLKYGIKQMIYNGKSEYSKVERIIKSAEKNNDIPPETPFTSISESVRNQIIKEVTRECKSCVIGALYDDFEGKIYGFSLKGDGITISYGAYDFISRHKMELEKINYYSWARFLEKINDDATSVRLLEKLDLATPQRKDLSVYREVLYKEFQENCCFYCGKKISDDLHVDHFIPWSFIKNDNLWNFVITCSKCNITKSNRLIGGEYIKRIEKRNTDLIEKLNTDEFVKEEFKNYQNGLIRRIWLYAKLSGVKEKI